MVRRLALWILLTISLSGCVYSDEIKRQAAPPSGEYITLVQQATDLYRQKFGVLPIKTKEMDTPLYEKYMIDFKKLKERNLLSIIPTNAFENGGSAIYVLVNVETKPEVKMMDLAAYQTMVSLQKEVDQYIQKKGNIPKGELQYPGIYTLDFSKLGTKNPQISSAYSRQTLNVVIHENGEIALDYAIDIVQFVNKSGNKTIDPNLDLRELLVQSSYFVPVRSFPYRWVNNQPLLLPPVHSTP